MATVERIKMLCKERHTSVAKMERELGFGNGYISNLRRDTLPYERLVAVADYLGVSPEYLTTGDNETPAPTDGDGLNDIQRQLIDLIGTLDNRDASVLLATAQSLIASHKSQDDL